MRMLIVFTISLAVVLSSYSLFPAKALAQSGNSSGSGEDEALTAEAALPAAAPEGQTNRYVVTNMRSTTGGAVTEGTNVKVLNLGAVACDVSVTWFRDGLTTPDCTTTETNLAAGTGRTFCSRLVSDDDFAWCDHTCNPQLTFNDGEAFVSSTSGKDCKVLGVDAQIFYTDTTTGSLLAVHGPHVVKLKGNKGD